MQNKIYYRIGGPVTRSQHGIVAMGISIYTSWPGSLRLVSIDLPNANAANNIDKNKEGAAVNSADNDNDCDEEPIKTIETICFDEEKKLYKRAFSADLFNVAGTNIYQNDIGWECVIATWNRVCGNSNGRVTFSFPLSLLGDSWDFEAVHEIVTSMT